MDSFTTSNNFETFEEQEKTKVRAPRSVWLELILMLCSCGIYWCFWMVGRANDLKNTSSERFTPWLWFFTPLFAISYLFAFPKMFRVLTELEDESTTNFWKYYAGVWIGLLFISSVVMKLQEKFGWTYWLLFTSIIIVLILFIKLHVRFNKWKEENKQSFSFHSKPSGFHWYEWIVVVVCGSFVLFAIYAFSSDSSLFVDYLEEFEDQQIIKNEKLGFELQIHGDEWSRVEIGTYSDGSAEYELAGPALGDYFIVFTYSVEETLNTVSESRFIEDAECKEERVLSEDKKTVISYAECEGSTFGDPYIVFSTLIEVDSKVVELYGYMSETKSQYKNVIQDMRKIAKGFKPL